MKTQQLMSEIQRIIRRHCNDPEFLRRLYAAITLLEVKQYIRRLPGN